MKTLFAFLFLWLFGVLSSFAQKPISMSQIKDVEWKVVDNKWGRTAQVSIDSISWFIEESGTKVKVLNEMYYLTNEEPVFQPDKDEWFFDHSQVGRNAEGKYIMLYEKESESTHYYIVKDYDSNSIYLEEPAFYFIHNGEKVYMTESRTITLKKIKNIIPQLR